VFFQTIVADLESQVHDTYKSGPTYWPRVILKALITPAIHVVVLYRISALLYQHPLTRPLAFLLRSATIVWGGTEIHPDARIGPGLCLVHSQSVVIGAGVEIGANARIAHGVGIGADAGRGTPQNTGFPVIGDDVEFAAFSAVLGPVSIGSHAVIGAQSLVMRDVPPYALVMGSPGRTVRKLDEPSDPEAG
jgi:serine O-acetyltransferase